MQIDDRTVTEAVLGVITLIGSGFVAFYARTTAKAIEGLVIEFRRLNDKVQTHETEIAVIKVQMGLKDRPINKVG